LRSDDAASITQVYVVVGADLLDVDNYKETTTAGTAQGTQLSAHGILRKTQEFMVRLVDLCRQVAEEVVMVPVYGNHDRLMSLSVYTYLSAWFSDATDVVSSLEYGGRIYRQVGDHFLMFTHGDMPKKRIQKLPQIAMAEAKDKVAQSTYYSVFTGHFHYEKVSIDDAGFKLYQAPYPGRPSQWADYNGYTGARRGVQGVLLFGGSGDDMLLNINMPRYIL